MINGAARDARLVQRLMTSQLKEQLRASQPLAQGRDDGSAMQNCNAERIACGFRRRCVVSSVSARLSNAWRWPGMCARLPSNGERSIGSHLRRLTTDPSRDRPAPFALPMGRGLYQPRTTKLQDDGHDHYAALGMRPVVVRRYEPKYRWAASLDYPAAMGWSASAMQMKTRSFTWLRNVASAFRCNRDDEGLDGASRVPPDNRSTCGARTSGPV